MAEHTHKQLFPWGFLGSMVLMSLLLIVMRYGSDKFAFVDYYDYHHAAELIRNGESPYDGPKADELAKRDKVHAIKDSHYIYPPPLAIVLVPLSYLHPKNGGMFWHLLSAIMLLLALERLTRYSQTKRQELLILLSFFFVPTLFTLYVGQVNTIVLALIVLAMDDSLSKENRDIRVGVWIGLAALIKVSPILLLAVFLFRGKWRVILVSVAVVAVGFAISELIVRGSTSQFFNDVMPSLWHNQNHHAHPANQSFRGWILRLFTPNDWTNPVRNYSETIYMFVGSINAFIVCITMLMLWISRKSDFTRRQAYLEAGLVVSCIVLISPLGWDHTFILLLIPAAALWRIGYHWLVIAMYGLMIVQRAIFIPFADNPSSFPFLAKHPVLSCSGLLGGWFIFFTCAHILGDVKKSKT
ncbi:glycosyltransferase family 87 protein [Patescibacteria group bacterium]